MLVLDDTIVNVALPAMQRSLHLPASSLNWVISFYALAFGGLQLAGGRAGDLFGRLRLFRAGIVVFVLASMAGGFAPNETVLITARIVQGCGAAMAAPCALSLLAVTFPAGPARTKALGVYGAMAGLGSVVGLLLGGTLTEYASWRWVLFINAPIGIAVLAATWTGVLVPGDTERGRLDVPGAVTATLGIAALIYALTRGGTDGWTDAGTLVAFAAGAVLLVAFAAAERRSRAPMLPLSLIRDRNRGGANAVHAAARHGHARHVLPAHPLPAAGARLLGTAHRPVLPAERGRPRHRGRRPRSPAVREAARAGRRGGRTCSSRPAAWRGPPRC